MWSIQRLRRAGLRSFPEQPVARKLKSDDVLAALAELFVTRGPPAHTRPSFVAANAVSTNMPPCQ